MRFLFITLCFLSSLFPAQAEAKSDAQKFIDQQLKSDPHFRNAVAAILAVDQNGNIVAEWNSNLPLLTASTLKTVTTGLGLYYLGPDYKFVTRLAYSGEVRDSTLFGNLYIIGGGDPTLGSESAPAFPVDSIFGIWKNAISGYGIKRIEGNIVVNDGFLEREAIPDSWSWGNIGADYGSAPSGLNFHENTQRFKLIPGRFAGDTVSIIPVYPQVPGLHVENLVKTGAPGSGDRSMYYIQDISLTGRYCGTVPAGRDSVVSLNSNKFPHLSCGYEFRRYLLRHGIESRPEILDESRLEITPDRGLIYIAETYSPELQEIVYVTNHISNNLYAETIFKTIGKEMTGSGSYDSARVAVNRLLKELRVDPTGFEQNDGSGLSRQNYVSPQFFCNYYEAMAKLPVFPVFLQSLPVPGADGTLKNVLKNEDGTVKSRIHAKSGSLSNVKCYAGYVENPGKAGLVRFAILLNNYTAKNSQIQGKLEKFMKTLATGK